MQILLVGSGGREHALAWKLSQSTHVRRIYVAPGNGGTQNLTKCENIDIPSNNIQKLLSFACELQIDLTIIGPEEPLVNGIVDAFQNAGLKIFGPSKVAAQLEGSKSWAKSFKKGNSIPTANYESFTDLRNALIYTNTCSVTPVIKVSGLAAGKGVYIPDCYIEAEAALFEIFKDKKFGEEPEVVIEERLEGVELSVLAFCDGKNFRLMPIAQDHKRLYDDDKGPNTGGMGAYAPVPDTEIFGNNLNDLLDEIAERVFKPTLEGMSRIGNPYIGILYAGLMLTSLGPQVLEFNCRFGDPEAQVLLPLLKSDLLEIIFACLEGNLSQVHPVWSADTSATVVMAAEGYPGNYRKGDVITGLDKVTNLPNLIVFHAGTALKDGKVVTNGGRVITVTGVGDDLPTALNNAYNGVDKIQFEGAFYRRDIGRKILIPA